MKQELVSFSYENSYAGYSTPSPSPATINQPLPGQPPLPPMPPPPGTLPPPPHAFGPVHSQVTPMQPWSHPPPPWQWMTPQTPPLPPQSPREMTPSNFQREMPLRSNYVRRDRFNHNRNNIYNQRNNFHRKNRRHPRYDQPQGQFDQSAYFGQAITGAVGLDWSRNNYSNSQSIHPGDGMMNHISVAIQNHQLSQSLTSGASQNSVNRHGDELGEGDIKIVSVRMILSSIYPFQLASDQSSLSFTGRYRREEE